MRPCPPLSYAQRFEDFHLWRCFGDRSDGFYIDIGAGHPVYDNVSFAFYLAGWRGITVEPNPALAGSPARCGRATASSRRWSAPTRAKRPSIWSSEFHGLSTTIAAHAAGRAEEVGKRVAGDDRRR